MSENEPAPPVVSGQAMPAQSRIHSLDGLRGIFALAVFLFHLWGSGEIPLHYFGGDTYLIVSKTPLGALLAGWQYVLAFFILSGIALTLPLIKQGQRFNLLAYYPSRFLRLYLPVMASIGLASLLTALFARDVFGGAYQWLATQSVHHLRPYDVFYALALAQGDLIHLNAPLWSLRWELLFSLVLPIMFVLLLKVVTRIPVQWLLLILILVVGLGSYGKVPFLIYMTVFPVGMLLAMYLSQVQKLATKIQAYLGRGFFSYGILIIAGLLYWSSSYNFQSIRSLGVDPTFAFQVLASVAASLLLIFIATVPSKFTTFLDSRVVQFLGKISFSLYLTHLPVMFAIAYIIPPQQWWLMFALAIPICLTVGFLFWLLLERPIHWVSRRLRSWLAKRTDTFWQALMARLVAAANKPLGKSGVS